MLGGMLMGSFHQSIAQTFWIRLSGNRVILDARILGVEDESLAFVKDGRKVFAPIGEIEAMRTIEEADILQGALVGAGTGFAVGAAAGLMVNPHGDNNWTPVTTSFYGAVLGGIVGSVIGSTESPAVLELRGKTFFEKREAIIAFLGQSRLD